MSTQAQRLLRIQDSDERRTVTVTEADYKHRKMGGLQGQTYQGAGWTVVSYEDGTPYEDGQEPGVHAIHKTVNTPEIGFVPEETATPAASARTLPATPKPAPTPASAPVSNDDDEDSN